MARQYTSAELVAAVSNAGALGVLGCLDRPPKEVAAEIRAIRALTDKPFGVNFVLHRLDDEAFGVALAERVPVFSFFRGDDPAPAVARAHQVGALTMHQVTMTEEALRAAQAGVDVIVAQGTEAGGHCGHLPLSAFLPDVIRLIPDRPVLAAGGIVDGSGLAAAIALGASGVVMGTRFLATTESPASPNHKRAIIEAGPEGTLTSDRFDLLLGERPLAGCQPASP
jgi:nitronate monooxygenase/enoyl-[acyl-carrier protein] reductase II